MKKTVFVVCCLLFVVSCMEMNAQCAMCRAVAESAQDENNIAAGLNTGILYLLAVPYLLIGGIFVYFFRKPISEKIKKLKNQRL